MSTHQVKEARWNISNFRFAAEFADAGAHSQMIDLPLMNVPLMIEGRDQPWLVGGLDLVEDHGPALSQLHAVRGVKIGGVIWTSHFMVQMAQPGIPFSIASAICEELLWTRRLNDEGVPVATPRIQETWRPINTSDDTLAPLDGDGDLVRIHRRRMTLLPIGNNAFDYNDDFFHHFNPNTSTTAHPNWGGAQSLRLRHWIPEEQQLSLCGAVSWTYNPAGPISITWVVTGSLYWSLVK